MWLMPLIPAIWKAEVVRIQVQGKPRQQFSMTHLKEKAPYGEYVYNLTYAGHIGRRLAVQS
jgi:hypothetical protein